MSCFVIENVRTKALLWMTARHRLTDLHQILVDPMGSTKCLHWGKCFYHSSSGVVESELGNFSKALSRIYDKYSACSDKILFVVKFRLNSQLRTTPVVYLLFKMKDEPNAECHLIARDEFLHILTFSVVFNLGESTLFCALDFD